MPPSRPDSKAKARLKNKVFQSFPARRGYARLSPPAKIFDFDRLPSARELALLVLAVFFRRQSRQKNENYHSLQSDSKAKSN
jgi:hypothetical protein